MMVGMLGRFWGEAVMMAVYLLNRPPTQSLDRKTPHEAWYNEKPTVRHLRVFGCVAYMKDARPHLAKLDPRGLKVVVISYEPGSKAYKLYTSSIILRKGELTCHATSSVRDHLLTVERRDRGRPKPKSIHGGVPRHQAGRRRSAASETITATSSCTGHAYANPNHNSGCTP